MPYGSSCGASGPVPGHVPIPVRYYLRLLGGTFLFW